LVDDCQTMHPPPANVKRFPANVKRLESKKFYICSDVTHTHKPFAVSRAAIKFSSLWTR